MKRFISFLLLLSLLFSIHAVTVVHISDPHYLSSSLFDYERLRNLMMKSDGKATHIMDKVMDEFVEEMKELKPDAVVITGDLTYNGEKQSHLELRSYLVPLQEEGIKVYVTVGNHDTLTSPYALLKEGAVETEGTSPMEGEEIWSDFGYGKAEYQDGASSSYLTRIKDDIWLLVLDSNNGSSGSVRQKTLTWMEGAIKAVKAKGGKIICATHQNLFVHNPRYTFGYQINNSSSVLTILNKYGIKLNLSGHLHIQHIKEEKGVKEIAAESFADWPLQYGILEIQDDGSYSYCTKEIQNKDLIEEAQLIFDASTSYVFSKSLQGEDMDLMMEVCQKLNREYFRGMVDGYDEDALELFPKGNRMTNYLELIISDTSDHRKTKGTI